jgi:hypothetical protein
MRTQIIGGRGWKREKPHDLQMKIKLIGINNSTAKREGKITKIENQPLE